MRRGSHNTIALHLLIATALLCPAFLGAATVRQMSLKEIVETADRVFVGTCIDVRSLRDGYGLPATFVTFSVQEGIKGNLGKIITIKVIGGGGGLLRIEGMPAFHEGEEVLLALYPNSQYGFTSPVGLQQGKWTVVEKTAGKKMLHRSLAGAAILGAPTYDYDQDASGMVDYTRFMGLVKRLARR